MSKEKKIKSFNPNDLTNINNNIFGLPFNIEESEVILIPVPWDVTVSYKDGSSKAPEAIFKASFQVDLYDAYVADAWKLGISMDPVPTYWQELNKNLRKKAEDHIKYLETRDTEKPTFKQIKKIRAIRNEINLECKNLNKWVREQAIAYLNKNKIVGIVGGDHSSSLGLLMALAERHKEFAVLQIDAHADLRKAYQGFAYSHASAMYNVSKIPQISKIVQIGIRDYCEEELTYINSPTNRITTFFDREIKHQMYCGKQWKDIANEIISTLPELVYLSFDIDGLDPKLCPNTGTPVPGGFDVEQLLFLFEKMIEKGKKIIGFDLCEVVPSTNEWDENVGARVIYKVSNIAALSKRMKEQKK